MQASTQNSGASRIRGLLAAVILLFSILIFRLFYLQVATSEDYARESDENRIAQKRIKAPRGLVVARDGEVLARNRASYTIFLIPSTAENDKNAVAALQAGDWGRQESHSTRHWRSPRLKRDVDFGTVSIVEERLRADWPLGIEVEPQRSYPHRTLAAHLLGIRRGAPGRRAAEVPRQGVRSQRFRRQDGCGEGVRRYIARERWRALHRSRCAGSHAK